MEIEIRSPPLSCGEAPCQRLSRPSTGASRDPLARLSASFMATILVARSIFWRGRTALPAAIGSVMPRLHDQWRAFGCGETPGRIRVLVEQFGQLLHHRAAEFL